jgi:spermidine/putrescine-binding protein
MSSKPVDHPLATALRTGALSRRAFVERALALGVGASAIGSFLASCGDDAPPPPPADAPAVPVAEAKPSGELRIYNWSDYIAEDTVPKFEAETGIKVVYDTYESNEELIAKLQAGAAGYDLVCPSGYAVQVLLALNLLAPLQANKVPNLANVAPPFRKTRFDPTDGFTVPWQWGMTGIAYRKDKLPAPPDSWGIFHDKALKGKMTMMDDMRDVLGAWLRFNGKSLNSSAPEELEAAKVSAIQARENLQSFISAPVKGQLVAGDVWVSQLWNGDSNQATAEQPEIAWVLPKEGGSIWTDAMCIPKTAPNPAAAHAFLDFCLRPDIGAAIAEFTGYGTPNTAAMAAMTGGVQLPSPEEFARLEYQLDLGAATEAWDRIWTEVKAG